MNSIKSCKTKLFAGYGIELWHKNGTTVRLGDGLYFSDGTTAYIWTGQKIAGKKSIEIPANSARKFKVEGLEQVTYKDMDTESLQTLKF